MSSLHRRSCLKIAPSIALPTLGVKAVEGKRQNEGYISSIEMFDDLPYFPAPDQGDILRGKRSFLYVGINENSDPNPSNSWVETDQGEFTPVRYPKGLWVDDSYTHTIWTERVEGETETYVDDGMLFEVPKNIGDIGIYVDGVEQRIEKDVVDEITSERPKFSVNQTKLEQNGNRAGISLVVRNEAPFESTFRGCINVRDPAHYCRFVEKRVKETATIESEVFTGSADPEEVEIELVSAHIGASGQ